MFLKALSLLLFSALFTALLTLSSCQETETQKAFVKAEPKPVPEQKDTAGDIALLRLDTSDAWQTEHLFPKTSLFRIPLSPAELATADSILKVVLTNSNNPIHLADYKRQYISVHNAKNETELWVNCFCKSIEKRIEFTEWKKLPVRVSGGGSCFFHIKMNLTRKSHGKLQMNGEA